MNIIRQGGASIGTAVLSVILASEITSHLGTAGSGGLESVRSLSPAQQAAANGPLAESFASTFVWALVLLGVAFIPALFMALGKMEDRRPGWRPRRRPRRPRLDAVDGPSTRLAAVPFRPWSRTPLWKRSSCRSSRRAPSRRTVERLGTAIRLGLLAPGSKLPPERELAKQLRISRSTLRQALTTLVQERPPRLTARA